MPNQLPLGLRRERRTLDSAVLTSGVEQVIDFVLPLFAGSALGLTAAETGLLVATSALVAFVIRPIAGLAVDRGNRSNIAALGAVVFAVGCGLYALATGFPSALLAAALTGLAGSFLWVAIRSIIGERLPEDSSVFAKLVSAEETGGWLVLVPALALLSFAGYQWTFVALSVCCLVAAAELWRTGESGTSNRQASVTASEPSSMTLWGLGRAWRPMLFAVVVTMTAEAAIALLLILHLQRGFDLSVIEVAYVFLPGAIAMSILPPYLHRLVVRYGRRNMLMLGSLASALFAVGLAFAPSPGWIAALWILSGVAWSVVIPVQQSVIAESAGTAHLGKALGIYEAASLGGAFIGSLGAGFLYDTGSWLIGCIVCAVVIASGIVLLPAAISRLGVTNYPAPAPAAQPAQSLPDVEKDAVDGNKQSQKSEPRPEKSRRELLTDLAFHSGLLAVALLISSALVPGLTFASVLSIGSDGPRTFHAVRELFSGDPDIASVILTGLRIWMVVYVIDVVWTGCKVLSRRSAG